MHQASKSRALLRESEDSSQEPRTVSKTAFHPVIQDLAKTELIVGAMRRHLAASRELEHSLKNFVGLRSLDDFSANIYVIVHTNSSATREFGESPLRHSQSAVRCQDMGFKIQLWLKSRMRAWWGPPPPEGSLLDHTASF